MDGKLYYFWTVVDENSVVFAFEIDIVVEVVVTEIEIEIGKESDERLK